MNIIKGKKIILVILICIVIVSFSNVKADALQDARTQYNQILKEQKENMSKLEGIEKEIAEYNYDIVLLDQQVTEATIELNNIQEKLDAVNDKINELEASLQNSSQSYNSAQQLYLTRLRIIYENGMPSMIDTFFVSKSITDFFSRVNVLNSILDYDKKLVSNMKSQKEYVNYIKKDIDTQKIQLSQLKYNKEESTTALNQAVKAKESKVQELNSSKEDINERNELLKKQEKEAKQKVDDELTKLIQDQNNLYAGNFAGTFTWPVPGYYKITAAFDDKEYYSIMGMHHTGVDAGISEGTPVVAAADGKVLVAGYNTGGYGYYVVIDHGTIDGSRYVTLYGHASSILVSKNDTVTKGQKILLSGNTGNSTGPHLHFEINKITNNVMYSIDAMTYYASSGAPFTYLVNGKWIDYPFSTISQYQYSNQLKRSYSF